MAHIGFGAARSARWCGEAIDNVVLYRLMLLAQNPQASEQARAIACLKLDELRKWMMARRAVDAEERAHLVFAASQINVLKTIRRRLR